MRARRGLRQGLPVLRLIPSEDGASCNEPARVGVVSDAFCVVRCESRALDAPLTLGTHRVIPRERSDRGTLQRHGSGYARARSLASLGMTAEGLTSQPCFAPLPNGRTLIH